MDILELDRRTEPSDEPAHPLGISEITTMKNEDWVSLIPALRIAIRGCNLSIGDMTANFRNLDDAVKKEVVEALSCARANFVVAASVLNIGAQRIVAALNKAEP